MNLDQLGIKDISQCDDLLDLQIHYDNLRVFLTSKNSSGEHTPISQKPLELRFDKSTCHGDGNDGMDTIGDITLHFQEVSEC